MSDTSLIVPNEYYPRYIEIVSTKENLFMMTPCGWWESKLSSVSQIILNRVFVVVSLFLIALILPILQQSTSSYYVFLSGIFIVAFMCSKAHLYFSMPTAFSAKWIAQKFGYKSEYAPLKPFDERMIRKMANLNDYALPKGGLIFDDMYSFLFDKLNPRRTRLLVKPKLSIVN